MTGKQSFGIFLVMFLAFSGPIIIAMFTLELVGLGEYTTPIFAPILIVMFVVSMFVGGVILLSQRRSALTSAISGEDDFLAARRSMTAVFSIPLQCPHCGSSIRLDQVRWEGPMDFTCAECMGPVRVKVAE